MTTPHTPEPWHESECSLRDICDGDDQVIGETCPTIDDNQTGTMIANRARIISCVNALAGVPEPAKALALVRDVLSTAMKATYDGDLCDWEELAGALAALGATP